MSRANRNASSSEVRGALAALSEQSVFEALLADLAACFADAPAAAMVPEVERALARLVDFFGYDRCSYAELGAPGGPLNMLASAAASGIAPTPKGEFGAQLKWWLGELHAGRVVAQPDLPRGLPPHAVAEAEFCRRFGLRSHLAIPLRARGRVAAVLSFAGVRATRPWPSDVITRLTIIGEIFASAMGRARSEEEAHQLRNRLWHADRVTRVSALTAAIAHEINQPLTAILSNAQAGLANLNRGEVSRDAMREILEAVVRDDKRAAETIRTMRALLRQDESGREHLDLASALHDVLGLLTTELARKGIRTETRLDKGCWVRADRTQIEQVALNLLLNAADAMEPCAAQERVLRLSAHRGGEGRVAVEVSDTGRGIPAEHLQAVFEPFWTTRREGLGLGLAICRSIVEAHGGTIGVVPNAGGGVTFRFELPGAAAAADAPVDAQPAAVAAREASAPAPHSGPLVCVVDDDAAVRESLVRLLVAEGWPAVPYASATEFLQRQPLAAVGCLLLDNQMPGLSGLELQKCLASDAAAPPVVFLTGHRELSAGVHAMKLGAVDFLVKPVEAAVLSAAVRKALARHALEGRRARERAACLARLSRLSAREREVMAHVVRGQLNKQIAADLDIALQTVKQHRSRVMKKMEVSSVADLVRACAAAGTT